MSARRSSTICATVARVALAGRCSCARARRSSGCRATAVSERGGARVPTGRDPAGQRARLRHTIATELLRARRGPAGDRPGAAPPERRDDRGLCQGRPRRRCRGWRCRGRERSHERASSSSGRLPARCVARWATSSTMHGRVLPQFVEFLEQRERDGDHHQPGAGVRDPAGRAPASCGGISGWRSSRGFARYLHALRSAHTRSRPATCCRRSSAARSRTCTPRRRSRR